jgi:hypothetical protein
MRRFSILLCSFCLLVLISGSTWAQQGEPTEKATTNFKPVEFSNLSDKQVTAPGTIDGLDPEQVLFTVPKDLLGPPNPRNSFFDYGGTGEVDALANEHDYLFNYLIANRKALLVSFQGDPIPTALATQYSVFLETPGGAHMTLWSQQDFESPVVGLNDVDGLELYQTDDTDDANCYSLVGDAGSGTSVYKANGVPFVPQSDIVAAVQALGFNGSASMVDLDALMVQEAWPPNDVWGPGDTILFSIKAAANWDGGELVVLPFNGKPGSASFLNHGGHLWNTGFAVATNFHVNTEEVDAIEVINEYMVPTLTNWGLLVLLALLILSGIIVIRQRRRGVVRA